MDRIVRRAHLTRCYSTSRVTFKYNNDNAKEIKESWDEYVRRLQAHDRQELERALRNMRRDTMSTIDIAPKERTTPSMARCKIVFIFNFVPFIFFGFLDNCLMILFGDAIEVFLGVHVGIGTMACAGFGNTFSDAVGVGAAGYIEKFSTEFLGMKTPDLNVNEQQTSRARYAKYGGQVSGIIIGCLLGMCPLLLIGHDADSEEKKKKTCKSDH